MFQAIVTCPSTLLTHHTPRPLSLGYELRFPGCSPAIDMSLWRFWRVNATQPRNATDASIKEPVYSAHEAPCPNIHIKKVCLLGELREDKLGVYTIVCPIIERISDVMLTTEPTSSTTAPRTSFCLSDQLPDSNSVLVVLGLSLSYFDEKFTE